MESEWSTAATVVAAGGEGKVNSGRWQPGTISTGGSNAEMVFEALASFISLYLALSSGKLAESVKSVGSRQDVSSQLFPCSKVVALIEAEILAPSIYGWPIEVNRTV
jgi:hypothetical protein